MNNKKRKIKRKGAFAAFMVASCSNGQATGGMDASISNSLCATKGNEAYAVMPPMGMYLASRKGRNINVIRMETSHSCGFNTITVTENACHSNGIGTICTCNKNKIYWLYNPPRVRHMLAVMAKYSLCYDTIVNLK